MESADRLIQDRIQYLRKNTDFVSTIFDSLIGYAIIAADFDGNIIAYNEGAHQIYGYAPEEVIGKENIEIFFPEEVFENEKFHHIVSKLIRKGRFAYEGEKVRKDGKRFPANILFTLTKDKNAQIVGYIVIAQDLTARKQTEKLLKASEDRLRRIIESNADSILIVDREGLIRFVNPAAAALFDRSEKELLGSYFGFPVVYGKRMEIDIVRPNGVAVAEMRVAEIEWQGQPAYLSSLRDITEMHKARQRVDLLANLVENARYVMIFIVDPDGRIMECNALAADTFGYSKSEMSGRNMGPYLNSDLIRDGKRLLISLIKSHSGEESLWRFVRTGESFPWIWP